MLEEAAGGNATKARKANAQASAGFITNILIESGRAAFSSADREMRSKGKVMEYGAIEADMYDRAAMTHAKSFVEGDVHSAYLQESRKMGRVGTVVMNPETNEEIDTRTYGNSRARHRSNNNRLSNTPKVKPPPLYPAGSAKVARKMSPHYASAVTPPSRSVYPQLKSVEEIDISPDTKSVDMVNLYSDSDLDDCRVIDPVDDMVERVTRRAFDQTGVLQSVVNVDSGVVEKVSMDKVSLYKNVQQNSAIVRAVIGETLARREVSSSIECLDVIKPFVQE